MPAKLLPGAVLAGLMLVVFMSLFGRLGASTGTRYFDLYDSIRTLDESDLTAPHRRGPVVKAIADTLLAASDTACVAKKSLAPNDFHALAHTLFADTATALTGGPITSKQVLGAFDGLRIRKPDIPTADELDALAQDTTVQNLLAKARNVQVATAFKLLTTYLSDRLQINGVNGEPLVGGLQQFFSGTKAQRSMMRHSFATSSKSPCRRSAMTVWIAHDTSCRS